MAEPCVKWVGGKRYLVPEILKRLPPKIKTYYEPFLGGGAVFFALAKEARFECARLNDANEELMQMYRALAFDVDAVVRALRKHVYTEKHFYAVRAQSWKRLSAARAAARFIFLNRTCFNGLYRVNSKGRFNVPFGRYSNPTICDAENLRAVSETIGDVWLLSMDFEHAVRSGAKRGDAVYFDSPYVPVSDTANFTAFTKGGFGPAEQERLRDCFAALDKRRVHVLLSNSNTPLVRKLYEGYRIEKVRVPRRVNSDATKRGDVTELLISGRNTRW